MLADGVSTLKTRSPQVVMEPNETYWNPDRKPAVRIIYDNAISKEDAIRSVSGGDGKIDVVMDLNVDEAKSFAGTGGGNGKGKLQTKAAKTVLVGLFNENKPNSPWRDPELRRAMNLALDRQMILDKGANGYGLIMPALIQQGRYGADPAMKPYVLDVQRALGTIEGANIPAKEIVVFAGPDWKSVVEAIAECLARVGLKVKPIYGKEDPPDWDIKLVWHFDWSPQYPVGVVHREFFGSNGALRASPEDERFDALYAKLLKTPHQPAQEDVVREVERYVFDNAKALFLFSPYTLFAVSNRVEFMPYDTCMSELAETKIRSKPV